MTDKYILGFRYYFRFRKVANENARIKRKITSKSFFGLGKHNKKNYCGTELTRTIPSASCVFRNKKVRGDKCPVRLLRDSSAVLISAEICL